MSYRRERPRYFSWRNSLLLLSALSGAILAIGQRPTWQDPVEAAQVLAGLVSYPHDNPVYIYSIKIWSLLNQLSAILLHAGVTELWTSHLIAGLVGATSFAGLFLIVDAISGKPPVAFLTPLLMYSLSLVGASGAYPIALLGSSSSYGIIGLSYTLMVIGLLGTGRYRAGGFLAGLAPAVHPGLGTFCIGLVTVSVLINLKELRQQLPRFIPFFVAGGVATAASLAWQMHTAQNLPHLDPLLKQAYLDAFIRNFDHHRTAGGWLQPEVFLGLLLAAVSSFFLLRKRLPIGAQIVVTSIVVSVVTTLMLVIATEQIPPLAFLKVLIPWRFINYANICILPVAFGILSASSDESPRSGALFACLLASCLILRVTKIPAENFLFFSAILATGTVLIPRKASLPRGNSRNINRYVGWLTMALIALFMARQVIPGTMAIIAGKARLPDRTDSQIYRMASEQKGILLTAGDMHLVQLVTRRPVLLDGGALDMFNYIPETGPRFNEILKKIYGLDIFAMPPDKFRNIATIPYSHKSIWGSWGMKEWCAVRKEFGVTAVVTPDTWRLNLPLSTEGEGLALYTIPDCGR